MKMNMTKDYNKGYEDGLTAGLAKAAEQYQNEIDRLNLHIHELETHLRFAHYEPSAIETKYIRLGKAIETIIKELK